MEGINEFTYSYVLSVHSETVLFQIHRSTVRYLFTGQHSECRTFACPVHTQKTETLALLHTETYSLHYIQPSVTLAQLVDEKYIFTSRVQRIFF